MSYIPYLQNKIKKSLFGVITRLLGNFCIASLVLNVQASLGKLIIKYISINGVSVRSQVKQKTYLREIIFY